MKVKLPKKKQHSTFHLNLQEWTFLSELLNNGYPMLEALHFLGKDITFIQTQLEEGIDITTILLKKQKGRFYDHLRFFMRITALADAITCSMHLLHFEKGLRKNLVKKAAYPFFILVFAYCMLLFFSTYIIPQMLSSFDLDGTFSSLRLMVGVVQVFCNLFAILCILCGILALYLRRNKKVQLVFLLKIQPYLQFLKDYNSYIFGGYLGELESQGISTRMAMLYLKDIRQDTLFATFIQNVIKQLEQGVALYDIFETSPLLNEGFRLAFRIGSSTASLEKQLAMFMKQQEHVWEASIKKFGIMIQCIAYCFVGVVVLIVYQIMLIPLSMLENM